jgi:chorismate-pyruvate lyase
VNGPPRSAPELEALAKVYYDSASDLAQFRQLREDDLPPDYRMLLAHHQHMTVTLEAHNGCPVQVDVIQSNATDRHYTRKVVLRRFTDQAVVLFGIVRITRSLLDPEILKEIESESTPLGTILIRKSVYRDVRLLSLWEIHPGEELKEIFGLERSQPLYGRTALMYCDGVPVIELLEIVTAD